MKLMTDGDRLMQGLTESLMEEPTSRIPAHCDVLFASITGSGRDECTVCEDAEDILKRTRHAEESSVMTQNTITLHSFCAVVALVHRSVTRQHSTSDSSIASSNAILTVPKSSLLSSTSKTLSPSSRMGQELRINVQLAVVVLELLQLNLTFSRVFCQ